MTNIALETIVTQTKNLIPDITSTELKTINLNQTCKQAVMDYGIIKPDEITADVTGDAGQYYPISNLTQWAVEFSRILAIQYPAPTVASDEVPIYLIPEDWDEDYYDGSTQYIYLPNHSPAATEAFRVRYTAAYAWGVTGGATRNVSQQAHGLSVDDPVYSQDDSLSWVSTESLDLMATHKVTTVTDVDNVILTGITANLPETDFFAICYKAACLVCREIATKYSRTSDSTILVDSVDHLSRADEFSKRAETFCKAFHDHMGIRTGDDGNLGPQGYAEFADWDNAPGWPKGRNFIFHGDR